MSLFVQLTGRFCIIFVMLKLSNVYQCALILVHVKICTIRISIDLNTHGSRSRSTYLDFCFSFIRNSLHLSSQGEQVHWDSIRGELKWLVFFSLHVCWKAPPDPGHFQHPGWILLYHFIAVYLNIIFPSANLPTLPNWLCWQILLSPQWYTWRDMMTLWIHCVLLEIKTNFHQQ